MNFDTWSTNPNPIVSAKLCNCVMGRPHNCTDNTKTLSELI